MAALKDHLDAAAVARIGAALEAPGFDAAAFAADAAGGLDALELMDRARHIAAALDRHLPAPFPAAAAAIEAALSDPELTSWAALPLGLFAADRGLDDPAVALPLLATLTPRFSSEFAIRPFLVRDQAGTLTVLRRWTDDPDEHVRRLVSEGTRPRLPWGMRLQALVADPSPAIALLDRLADDPSPYVRLSVANHLGDIAKDHPALAVATAERWAIPGDAASERLVRHGLRHLVKRGDPGALRLLGYDHDAPLRVEGLTVTPVRAAIGDEVTLRFTVHNDGVEPVPAVVDYAVHFQGARGPKGPKVFKLATRTVMPSPPAQPAAFERRHRFRDVSIRTHRPGPHRVDVQVNGRVAATASVDLLPPAP